MKVSWLYLRTIIEYNEFLFIDLKTSNDEITLIKFCKVLERFEQLTK